MGGLESVKSLVSSASQLREVQSEIFVTSVFVDVDVDVYITRDQWLQT